MSKDKLEIGTIVINGETFYKPKDWIDSYYKYGYNIPRNYTFLINRLTFKEFRTTGRTNSLNILPIFTEPHEVLIDNKIWRVCPLNPFIHVTEEGEYGFIERDNFGKEKGFIYKGFGKDNRSPLYNYKTHKATVNNKSITYPIHRLVATAFIPNDDYVKYCIIDHINGNTIDNRVSNLKWTSPESNTAKTRMLIGNKLEDNYTARNIDTKQILNFVSKTDMRIHFNCSPNLFHHETFEKGKVFILNKGRWEIQSITKFDGWAYEHKYPSGSMVNKPQSYKFWSKNLNSGDINFHDNVTGFCKMLDDTMKLPGVLQRVKNERFRKYPIGDYVIKFNKEDPWPDELPDFDRECKTMIRRREMVVVSTDNKERYEFASMKDMCKHFNIDHKAVRAYIKEDKPFKRLDKEWKVNFKE